MYTLTIDTSHELREQLAALTQAAFSRLVIDGQITTEIARQIATASIGDVEELYLNRFDHDPDLIDDEVGGMLFDGDWRSLRRVEMAHNPCGATTVSALARLPALEEVGLPLTTTGDHVAALVDSAIAPRLTRLDLTTSGLSDTGIRAIARANLAELRVLHLATTSASIDALASLAASEHLPRLVDLCYAWPRAGSDVVAALVGDHSRLRLRRLTLATVRLNDNSAERMVAKMRELEQLRLVVCTLDEAAVEAFAQLPSLRDLVLSTCIFVDDAARAAAVRLGNRVRLL
jgi:hypothetical protein